MRQFDMMTSSIVCLQLSAGSISTKNVANILMLVLLDACIGAIGWYLVGFAFAFGNGGKFIGGETYYAMNGLPRSEYGLWFFQYAFAATAATIVSGAVAGRTRFEAYLLYAVYLSMWVYPVVAHWVWSEQGFLSPYRTSDLVADSGVIDFAGCGVIHMVGGFAGLAGALVVGPRIGRFDVNGQPVAMPGHNVPLIVLGVFMLWFGWYGFNPGSAMVIIETSEVVVTAIVSTTLSGAAATITTLFFEMAISYIRNGVIVWDLAKTCNGCLAGLVGITACCSVVQSWAAICIGVLSALVYCGAWRLVIYQIKADDPLEAIALHGFVGMWGLIAAACFADKELMLAAYGILPTSEEGNPQYRPYGFIMGGDGSMLAANLAAICVIFAWVMAFMLPFFYIIKLSGLLRVPEEFEIMGLDVSHHGGSAYPADNDNSSDNKQQSVTKDNEVLGRLEIIEKYIRAQQAQQPAKEE